MASQFREEAAILATAVRFLTRLPLPEDRAVSTGPRLMRSPRYYPAVGLLVGAVAAVVVLGLGAKLGPVVTILLATAVTVAMTGAMHEDGLADACDGLGGATPARSLEFMRDSRVGVFGLLGLGLTVAVKVAALSAMPESVAAGALVAAHGGSRMACVASMATAVYARANGTAGFTQRGIGRRGLAVAVATTLLALVGFGLVAGAGAAVAGAVGLAGGGLAVRGIFERRISGYTGDTLGACQQLAEAGFYLAVLAWL